MNLKNYKGTSQLKKAALNILVVHLSTDQIGKLKQQFDQIDTDLSGFIEFSELEEAIKQANISMKDEEISHIVKELDFAGNDKINFSEFIAATLDREKLLSDDKL